jgi:hypothetical protein
MALKIEKISIIWIEKKHLKAVILKISTKFDIGCKNVENFD